MPSLTKPQREAVILLQFGTILEAFDFMLYIHMAVYLNDIFFHQGDSQSQSLLAAFTLCTTYALRPLGALVFGYIGDQYGRRATITVTTALMALSCIIMANVPTYAQIGIAASWIVISCRALQGISAMGEVVGAEIYLMETIKPPLQYPVVGLCGGTMCHVGAFIALGVATLSTSFGFNWRMAFWIGAAIAVIGSVARTRLRETPEFLKIRQSRNTDDLTLHPAGPAEKKASVLSQIDYKVMTAHFVIQCAQPVLFYFIYIYCGEVLKSKFGYTGDEVIARNLIFATITLLASTMFALSTFKLHPLKLNFFKLAIVACATVFIATGFEVLKSPLHLGVLQCIMAFAMLEDVPSSPIFYKYMPTAVRFRCATMSFALGRAFTYIIIAFGYAKLTHAYGLNGVLMILAPTIISHFFALKYFQGLENKSTPPASVSQGQEVAA